MILHSILSSLNKPRPSASELFVSLCVCDDRTFSNLRLCAFSALSSRASVLLLLTMSNKNPKYQLQQGEGVSNAVPPRVCFELIRQYDNVDRCSVLRRQTAAIIKFKISSVEPVKFGGPLNLAALCGCIARIMPKAGSVHGHTTRIQDLRAIHIVQGVH